MNNMSTSFFIEPNWPAPQHIKALTTTRTGGYSKDTYASFNLADHVGDDPIHVQKNRALLKSALALPHEPRWLMQTHSALVVAADAVTTPIEADASYTSKPNSICCVLSADCLPLLLCHKNGDCVAAIHAGWRGLLSGIIENTVHAMPTPPTTLLAWLGPAIGPSRFEVGQEVFEKYITQHSENSNAFTPTTTGKWLADIYALATIRLLNLGVTEIYGGQFCTINDKQFYSRRRDGKQSGRMASLIYIQEQ